MDDEHFVEVELAPVKATRLDFFIFGVDFTRRVVGAVEELLSNVEQALMMHANYLIEQRAFADAARRDIETLTQEE